MQDTAKQGDGADWNIIKPEFKVYGETIWQRGWSQCLWGRKYMKIGGTKLRKKYKIINTKYYLV